MPLDAAVAMLLFSSLSLTNESRKPRSFGPSFSVVSVGSENKITLSVLFGRFGSANAQAQLTYIIRFFSSWEKGAQREVYFFLDQTLSNIRNIQ